MSNRKWPSERVMEWNSCPTAAAWQQPSNLKTWFAFINLNLNQQLCATSYNPNCVLLKIWLLFDGWTFDNSFLELQYCNCLAGYNRNRGRQNIIFPRRFFLHQPQHIQDVKRWYEEMSVVITSTKTVYSYILRIFWILAKPSSHMSAR